MGKNNFFPGPDHGRGRSRNGVTPVIEGVFLMTKDRIIPYEELDDYCEFCLEPLSYDATYDSAYCAGCNEWREETCTDPKCQFCTERPKRPFGRG
ncbi:hypothetical protein C772_00681 [Bhargavaea cecembensis DSE10]|uniref:Uncharacterized protein n=1 Tax=Bhargavaea cecembensis DSE10 TaxID=1235279 RepID=M7P185_9BACL|nr:hypothetical protein [Bhargavaea cecembensis]EMR07665.1 hypothetical protein C772_00681 [Bhargavaea cecembensis DSE10]